MCFFLKNLVNFGGMKTSIDFLPKRKQQDLQELVSLIRKEVKDVVMIILYGSYAKNSYVDRDERYDYGVRTVFMSDYDILIVTKKRLGERENTIETRVRKQFTDGDTQERPRPQIINESISKLNDALSEGRYFYVDILEQGIILYDSGEYQLVTPRELNYREIKEIAKEYFDKRFSDAKDFFAGTKFYEQRQNYRLESFILHQAAENFLKTIPLVHILYGYKEHDLEFLIEKCKSHTLEVSKIFPRNTEEEERLFRLLQRAYVEARYNSNFEITKEDIDTLIPRVEMLQNIVEKVCRERFDYYDSQIKNQE